MKTRLDQISLEVKQYGTETKKRRERDQQKRRMALHFIQGISWQSLGPLYLDMLFLQHKLCESDVVLNKTFSLEEIQISRGHCISQGCLAFASQKGEKNLNASVCPLLGTTKCQWREHLENFSGCVAKKDCNKILVPQMDCLHFVFMNTLGSYLRTVKFKYKQTYTLI